MPGGFHPTLEVIASWPKPNYDDPETQGRGLFAASISLIFIATVVVILRLIVRLRIQRQLGLDDLFLTIGLIFSIALTAVLAYSEFKPRWFRHAWDVHMNDHVFRHLHGWVVQFLFVFSSSCTKASILLLYRRVIQGSVNPRFMRIVKIAIASIFCYFFVFFFLMLFQCTPTESFWKQFSITDPYTEKYYCLPESHVPMANAAVSIVTDFVSACLPIFLFIQIKLPVRQKISLGILFGVGLSLCVLGVIRTVVMHHLFYETYDITWVIYYVWLFTIIENHLGVVCAALPPLRALVTLYQKKREREAELERNAETPPTANPLKARDPHPLVSWDPALLRESTHSMVQSMDRETCTTFLGSSDGQGREGTICDIENCSHSK